MLTTVINVYYHSEVITLKQPQKMEMLPLPIIFPAMKINIAVLNLGLSA